MDIPRLTRVVQFKSTSTLGEYMQHFGRAGREGQPAEAILLVEKSVLQMVKKRAPKANKKKAANKNTDSVTVKREMLEFSLDDPQSHKRPFDVIDVDTHASEGDPNEVEEVHMVENESDDEAGGSDNGWYKNMRDPVDEGDSEDDDRGGGELEGEGDDGNGEEGEDGDGDEGEDTREADQGNTVDQLDDVVDNEDGEGADGEGADEGKRNDICLFVRSNNSYT